MGSFGFSQMADIMSQMADSSNSMKTRDFRQRVELTRRGIPVCEAVELMETCRIPVARFAAILGTSQRKWSRLRAEAGDAMLNAVESDRLLRVREVIDHAGAVFDAPDDVVAWLAAPLPALSGEAPVSLLDTDAGVRAVDAVLTRLEFGVFG